MRSSDWSSDVCSSDLVEALDGGAARPGVDADAPAQSEEQGQHDDDAEHRPGAVDRHRPVAHGAPVVAFRLDQPSGGGIGNRDVAGLAPADGAPEVAVRLAAAHIAGPPARTRVV